MYRQFLESQMLDISAHPMEVAPTAHYSMGGVVVEPQDHSTDVEGLFAAGEVAAGLHGANRLGGNSLVETLIFGRRAGAAAAERSANLEVSLRARSVIADAQADLDGLIREGEEFARPLQRALRDALWEHCGVVRDEEGLKEGLARVADLREAAGSVDVRPTSEGFGDLAHALDLRAALLTAEATILGAIERRETRGAHIRSDHPDLDERLRVNLVVRCGREGRLETSRVPVPEVPEHLRGWLAPADELDVEGRLLE